MVNLSGIAPLPSPAEGIMRASPFAQIGEAAAAFPGQMQQQEAARDELAKQKLDMQAAQTSMAAQKIDMLTKMLTGRPDIGTIPGPARDALVKNLKDLFGTIGIPAPVGKDATGEFVDMAQLGVSSALTKLLTNKELYSIFRNDSPGSAERVAILSSMGISSDAPGAKELLGMQQATSMTSADVLSQVKSLQDDLSSGNLPFREAITRAQFLVPAMAQLFPKQAVESFVESLKPGLSIRASSEIAKNVADTKLSAARIKEVSANIRKLNAESILDVYRTYTEAARPALMQSEEARNYAAAQASSANAQKTGLEIRSTLAFGLDAKQLKDLATLAHNTSGELTRQLGQIDTQMKARATQVQQTVLMGPNATQADVAAAIAKDPQMAALQQQHDQLNNHLTEYSQLEDQITRREAGVTGFNLPTDDDLMFQQGRDALLAAPPDVQRTEWERLTNDNKQKFLNSIDPQARKAFLHIVSGPVAMPKAQPIGVAPAPSSAVPDFNLGLPGVGGSQ